MPYCMKLSDETKPLSSMTGKELSELFPQGEPDSAFILHRDNLYFISPSRNVFQVSERGKKCNPQINEEQINTIIAEIKNKPDPFTMTKPVNRKVSGYASNFDVEADISRMVIEQGKEKLPISQMAALKVELERNESEPLPAGRTFTFNSVNWNESGLTNPALEKLVTGSKNPAGIPVTVIEKEGQVLVQVGPCDLSGVGGHAQREAIIETLVNSALRKAGKTEQFKDVHVSAASGVRGRLQMFLDSINPLSNATTRLEKSGTHMNAYIKTAGEERLTHWEPRKGPQSFFNDTICALVTSIATNCFEHKVLEHPRKEYTSTQATQDILQNKEFKSIFDRLLAQAKTAIKDIVASINNFKGRLHTIVPPTDNLKEGTLQEQHLHSDDDCDFPDQEKEQQSDSDEDCAFPDEEEDTSMRPK